MNDPYEDLPPQKPVVPTDDKAAEAIVNVIVWVAIAAAVVGVATLIQRCAQ